MKRNQSLVILFVLVIAPMFPVLMVNSSSVMDEIPAAQVVVDVPNILPEGDVELTTMFFTETPSSEDGLYYVCRKGMDSIAYFGASMVKYLSGGVVFTLEFPRSNEVIPNGEAATGSITNYLFGNDPSKWKTGIEDFAVLRYPEIYPGIDLIYKIHDGNLKYEFVVAPDADPKLIRLSYVDVDGIEITDGGLIVTSNGQQMADTQLKVFQKGGAIEVGCSFSLDEGNSIIFNLDPYDFSEYLIIDPILLAYSTFLGGPGSDVGTGIAVKSGYAYITGYTFSPGFPTENAYNSTQSGGYDCFVTKLAVDGQSLVYSTFLGGTGNDYGYSISVESGYAYITGETTSSDFPTYSAFNFTYGEGADCFVTKLAIDGSSLVYSTFLGGSNDDGGRDIVVESGYAYITGETASDNFPTANAFDSTHNGNNDCFVTKLSPTGLLLTYSTFIGGSDIDSGQSISLQNSSVFITGYTQSTNFPTVNAYNSTHSGGYDCFVTKLAIDGSSLDYSTFLGGSGYDYGQGIAVELGYAYITGHTWSINFPTVNAYDSTHNGGEDCFVTKLAFDGQSIIYSTLIGGSGEDWGNGIDIENGYTYVTGHTASTDFPSVNAYDAPNIGATECFVMKLAVDGHSLVYSTLIGGSSSEYGFDISVEYGSAYITGYTFSVDFPVVSAYDSSHNGGNYDCFVTKLAAEDNDMDGLPDWRESIYGTDPYCIDTDNDNFLDGYEVSYGSDPLDPMSYPDIPQSWYEAIYEDLDGNATLIQNLIAWSGDNATLLQVVMQQLDDNATLLTLVISWLDGNHTAIETLLTYMEGNATMLLSIIETVDANSAELSLLAALIAQDITTLNSFNATYIEDLDEIREILDQLGVTVGDSDYDGLDDLDEISYGTDLLCIDTDTDNLNDAFEIKLGTDPLNDDSDGDTYLDGIEVIAGTDPLDPLSFPGSTQGADNIVLTIILIAGSGGAVIVVVLVIKRMRSGK